MVTDGRLEGVIEEVRGQLTSRRSGSLVDAFESPCDGFDLFLPSLSTLAVSPDMQYHRPDQIRPCNRSISPAILAPDLVRAPWNIGQSNANM